MLTSWVLGATPLLIEFKINFFPPLFLKQGHTNIHIDLTVSYRVIVFSQVLSHASPVFKQLYLGDHGQHFL